ncbi:glycosyltransferase family 4 protein [Chloroflexota bacterium]
MKIAILVVSKECDGVYVLGVSQAAIFAELGHEVTLFVLNDSDLLTTKSQVKVEFLKFLPGLSPRKNWWVHLFNILPPPLRLPFIYRCVRPISSFEAVIAYDNIVSWIGYYAKKFYGLKYIYFAEGWPFSDLTGHIYRRVHKCLWNYWVGKSCSNADLVATESNTLGEVLNQRLGVESIVTGSLIDLSLFNPSADGKRVRSLYGLSDDPLILFVDHLSPIKGIEILIGAFNLVLKSIPSARLMLIGKCSSRSYWERIQRQCNKSVILVDYVPHGELPAFYAASTIFATCALWEEGCSHTIAEAQACGKSVVAFKLQPHEEVVKDNETGILVHKVGDAQEFGSAMLKLLSDQSLTNTLGRNAADRASYLTKTAASNLQNLMDKIKSI